jgi:hypothetical protein
MPKNKIEDLRNILFETMEKLMDDDDPMDVHRAKAIGDVAQVVINTAKVEVEFLKQTGRGATNFLSPGTGAPLELAAAKTRTDEKPLSIGAQSGTDLCLQCPLPDCNEQSPQCLIQIERRKAAA